MRDTKGFVFGGYFSQQLEIREGFHGTGEAFIFKQSVVTLYLGLIV